MIAILLRRLVKVYDCALGLHPKAKYEFGKIFMIGWPKRRGKGIGDINDIER